MDFKRLLDKLSLHDYVKQNGKSGKGITNYEEFCKLESVGIEFTESQMELFYNRCVGNTTKQIMERLITSMAELKSAKISMLKLNTSEEVKLFKDIFAKKLLNYYLFEFIDTNTVQITNRSSIDYNDITDTLNLFNKYGIVDSIEVIEGKLITVRYNASKEVLNVTVDNYKIGLRNKTVAIADYAKYIPGIPVSTLSKI